MMWFDDELRQQSAVTKEGITYTVYLVAGRHEWTVARTLADGFIEWSGVYFSKRADAKAAALSLTYTTSSIPSPELNENVVRMFERKEA